jgi:hypothetical protein
MTSFLSHPSDREAARLQPARQQPHELFKQFRLIEHGRAAQETANALDAPAQKH